MAEIKMPKTGTFDGEWGRISILNLEEVSGTKNKLERPNPPLASGIGTN